MAMTTAKADNAGVRPAVPVHWTQERRLGAMLLKRRSSEAPEERWGKLDSSLRR